MAPLSRLAVALAVAAPAVNALYVNGSVIAPCDSPIYCHGDILEQVELARPFSDSKTFVDMPAIRSLEDIQEAFDRLEKPLRNNSALNDFLSTYFADAGGELSHVNEAELEIDAAFLDNIDDTVIHQFTEAVLDIWPDLTRSYTGSAGNCSDCPNSFIPVNRTFIVAGGRFREPYYWDSYWIIEGLLRTGGSFIEISKNIIENFLDFVEQFGFVPNGARIYYLNRSQPPLLSQMVKAYVESTNDTSILDRALPLLVKEHEFWMTNRTVDVEVGNNTYSLNRYAVQNTRPRPESYREDYITATNTSYYAESGIIYPQVEALNDTEIATLYSNLASGAESGWDYTARWNARPTDGARDVYFPLRYLNTIEIVPVDLNSILYGNEIAISEFFNRTGNETAGRDWAELAANRSTAMTAVFWNETLYSYFDFNLTSGAQNIYVPNDDGIAADLNTAPKGQQVLFSVAQFFPFWLGAAPDYIKNNPYAVKTAYSRIEDYLNTKAGGIPATNYQTGQQWDQPNVWPPLMHVLMQGLQNTPATFGENDPAHRDVHDLALRLGQRYLDSTFCTWLATGGETTETPRLPGLPEDAFGYIYEKYADNSTSLSGYGGEYPNQFTFGWSAGTIIWTVDTFGNELTRPDCGDLEAADLSSPEKRGLSSALEMNPSDSRRVKKFKSRAGRKRA
ncbi:Six-hairpin glycosidase-like protein [Stachybotrys elegans]|uniref:Trehalase n=1 Tax=Stachybotrys elegans TaxID=80388 RepID=A0A8K0WTV7_9HYPO|nr:Six-hairpin glycosidase-like protein [Stachybotrys elegans]